MAGSTVRDIPRCTRVVESVRVNIVVSERRVTLIQMDVTSEDQVDAIFKEERFKDLLALDTDRAAPVCSTYIPWTMARCQESVSDFQYKTYRRRELTDDNPGCLVSVNSSQVLLKPSHLGIHDAVEWSSIHSFTSTGLIRSNQSMAEVSFGVDLDIMNHAVVKRVPEVPKAA
jgi:hypothetical protein